MAQRVGAHAALEPRQFHRPPQGRLDAQDWHSVETNHMPLPPSIRRQRAKCAARRGANFTVGCLLLVSAFPSAWPSRLITFLPAASAPRTARVTSERLNLTGTCGIISTHKVRALFSAPHIRRFCPAARLGDCSPCNPQIPTIHRHV